MSTHSTIPIPTVAELQQHVHAAAGPTLLHLTAHLTGDHTRLRTEWKPSPAALPASGLAPEVDAEARAVCGARLAEVITTGARWPNEPTEEFLRAVADWGLESRDVEPITTTNYYPYANDKVQVLEPEPPKPYDEFEDTFR